MRLRWSSWHHLPWWCRGHARCMQLRTM
jgi:hypothetical protein